MSTLYETTIERIFNTPLVRVLKMRSMVVS